MAITYTWSVGALDTYPTASDSQDPVNTENDVIYNAHWTLTVSTGSYQYNSNGTQTLDTSDLSSSKSGNKSSSSSGRLFPVTKILFIHHIVIREKMLAFRTGLTLFLPSSSEFTFS